MTSPGPAPDAPVPAVDGELGPAASGPGAAAPEAAAPEAAAPEAAATEARSPEGRRPKSRLRQTVRDMVWSLAVVLGVVALVLLVTARPKPDPVRVVDYQPVLAAARAAAAYPVLAPTDLGADWRATSARWEPTPESAPTPAWHLGMLAPDDTYVQVGQAATTSTKYLEEQTLGGRPEEQVTIAGQPWTRYETPDERSLVRQQDGVTTVVTGTASWETLQAFAGALRGG